MSASAWLIVYSLAVLVFSLSGGSVPFLFRVTHSRLQLYLSLSAGIMIGAAFFHIMPDAMEMAGEKSFGWWMSLGVVGIFCIERFIAPHSHEVNGHGHSHHHGEEHHHHHEEANKDSAGHVHDAAPSDHHAGEPRAAAPAVAGWMAVLGLTLHTFMNGLGLAGAVQAAADKQTEGGLSPTALLIPGFALFLAIILHKPADALAISTVLARKGIRRNKVWLVQLGFGAMVPIGVLAFILLRGMIEQSKDNQELLRQLTGAALAFSAGTFLFVALSDLLPEVQFHQHDRVMLFMALISGIVLMGGISYLEPHEGDKEDHPAHVGKPSQPERNP
jgi:zinc and cadmium transporter